MEEVQSSLSHANQLEENGQVQTQSATILQPKQYASLISAIRTCLTHIEHIIETHSPGAPTRILVQQNNGDSSKFPKLPLPPKPSRIHKTVLPPNGIKANFSNKYGLFLGSTTSEYSNVRPRPPTPNVPTPSPYSVSSPDNRSLQKHRPFTEIEPPSDDPYGSPASYKAKWIQHIWY